MPAVHVVGAGLAGLSAAVRMAERGYRVSLYEAAPQAGGRCRSFFDRTLQCTIDNGNHLLLSGNRAVTRYLETIRSDAPLEGPDAPLFPFADLRSGQRWTVRPGLARLPWWLLDPRRRVPGVKLASWLQVRGLMRAGPDATLGEVLDTADPAFERFWDPLARAVLNTPPLDASAALLGRVVAETFWRGGRACRPLVAPAGLSASFVAPALRWLQQRGSEMRSGVRLRAIDLDGSRVVRLLFADRDVEIGVDEQVVLAVPAGQAKTLLPELRVPDAACAILNGHFRLAKPVTLPDGANLLGVIGGTTQWIFARGDLVSVTVSAADPLMEVPANELVPLLWRECAAALGLGAEPLPTARIVKEKRATFAQTPDQVARRPGPRVGLANLALAGDWTDTGLPATIEGALLSGERAAAALAGAMVNGSVST